MGGDSLADLDAELARHVDARSRIGAALLAVEQHPGNALLTSMTPAGTTARRWDVARDALGAVWRDFEIYRRTLETATQVRGEGSRLSPSVRAELHRLLHEPSIEVGRTLVERRLTGDVESIDTITLERLGERMDRSYRLVRDLVDAVAERHRELVEGIGPLVGRLRAARSLAAELGSEPSGLAGLVTRLEEIERVCAADPLAVPDRAPEPVRSDVDADLTEIEAELAGMARLRDGWDERVSGLRRAMAELDTLSTAERRTRCDVAERVVGVGPGPDDPRPVLQRRFDVLVRSPRDWQARARSEAELRRDVVSARDRLERAHREAAEPLQRRDELRGRFQSFQAKAVRLGCAEDPELLRLAAEIRRHLWERPADLDAAAPALASYQRLTRQTGRSTYEGAG